MHSLFIILFLIAPLVSPGQAQNKENIGEPLALTALTQALGNLASAREEFKALADGVVHAKFAKLPKKHFAAIEPCCPNEVQIDEEDFASTIRELGDIGYFKDEALRLASFLWAPSLAHEISHSLNFAELIKLTGLEPPPYVVEEEVHAHAARARVVANVLKSYVSENIMWQTTMGQSNLNCLKDFSKGAAYLRETVAALDRDLPSVFESNADSAQTEAQHKFLYAAAMAEARKTRVAEEERVFRENQYKFWSSPELIEKVKDFYGRQIKRDEALYQRFKIGR